jgi:hypothetical protein
MIVHNNTNMLAQGYRERGKRIGRRLPLRCGCVTHYSGNLAFITFFI